MNELISDRFEVLRPLGSGGASDVSLVRDRRDGSTRALKRLRLADGESLERFQAEFAELAALRHPNIVRVDEYGALDDGGRWILMDAIEGRPADQAVRPGDVSGALRLALDVIAGLDALHAAGRFHGDLKPSNILAGGPRAVLVDFGFMGRDREMPGGRKRGTPGYLAPEVLHGRAAYGRASDAYALGATLYRVLSGRPAFPGRDAAAILATQARGAPSMQPLESAGVPHALADLVVQLLAEDPEARVAALEDLRELVRRRVGGEDGAPSRAVLATSGPLVGRETERERLRAHLLGAGGGLRIALVAGPLGSGRTRMAHELAIEAELRGWTLEWHDAKSTPAASDPAAGGTLLVLDDVDEWPQRKLEALRPAPGAGHPTAILATARSPRLEGQPFLRWSLSVSEDVAPYLFELGALAPEACAELVRARLGGAVPGDVVEAIARETSRLPGAIAAVVARLVESSALRQSGSEWTLAPGESAEAAVRAAAGAAADAADAEWSREARCVLVAIAGSADPLDAGRVAMLTGLGADVVASTIEDLEWRGLVTRADGALRVVPPAMERIALERLEGEDVAPVRARLIEELSRDAGAPDPRRLRLVGSHAWARGDRATALSAWQGAWDARRTADRDEISELTRAVEELEFGAAGGEAAARLLAGIAEHWQSVNRPAIAERLWQRAADTWPSAARRAESDAFLARCDLERARCLFGLTRHADGLAALERLFERDAAATSLPAELRGEALTERGWGRAMLGRAAEAKADWDEALRVLPESAVAARVIAQNRQASFHIQWGEYEEARRKLEIALPLALGSGDRALESRVRANVAQLAANEGRYDDARAEYERVIAITRTIPEAFWYPLQLTNLCTIYSQLGDWSGWSRTFEEAVSLARTHGDVALLCGALESRESLEVRRGDLVGARRALRTERAWLRFSSRPDQHAHFRITTGVVRGLMSQEQTAYRLLHATLRASIGSRHSMSIAQSALALGDLFLRENRVRLADDAYGRVIASGYRGQNVTVHAYLGQMRVALRNQSRDALRTTSEALDAHLTSAPPLEVSAIRAEIRAAVAASELDDFRAAEEYSTSIRELEAHGLILRSIETAWEAHRTLLVMGREARSREFLLEAWRVAGPSRIDSWKSRIAVALAASPGRSTEAASQGEGRVPVARELLARVAELMNSLLDFTVLIPKSLELVARHLDAERGFILLVTPDTGEIRPVGRYGDVNDESQESALSFSRSVVRRVATSGEAFRVDDAATDPRLGSTQSVLDMAVRSILCTPLRIKDELIGTVYLESRSNASQFTEADLEILEAFSNLVALAIDSNRKYEALRRSRERMIGTNLSLRNSVESRFQPSNIIGQSVEIERVLDEVELIANSKGTVLITGESGTGKELIAKTIHYNSPRSDHPFLSLNCAALPTDLIEAELFGIESHAATGVQGRPGIFERADKGTLFLDEIGDMPTTLQAKLLRVLQEREFVRIGTTGRVIKVDVRLIAATNQDLVQMIRDGQFREDLFFRLHALPIHIAPLRERKADIIPLAEYFLQRFCEENGRPLPSLSPEFRTALLRHTWPGNVRELQHYVERAVVMSPGPVLKSGGAMTDLGGLGGGQAAGASPPSSSDLKAGETLKLALEEFEARVIRKALESAQWNQRKAARSLGLVEPTLRYKMSRLGIDLPAPPRRK